MEYDCVQKQGGAEHGQYCRPPLVDQMRCGEESGVLIGVVGEGEGGHGIGLCPRERWRRRGRVKRNSGRSDIRLLSSKITCGNIFLLLISFSKFILDS